jgi:hypothetical protein
VRWSLLVLGGLMVVVGGTWLLQGVGVLPGSFMTGQIFWAVVGTLVLVVGVGLVYVGVRASTRQRR